MATNGGEQPLVVWVLKNARTQRIGERLVQVLRLGRKVRYGTTMIGMPQVDSLLQQCLEPCPKVLRTPLFVSQHVADRPQDVRQTLLLPHLSQRLGIIAATTVGDHHPARVSRNDFLHFLMSMAGANLVHRRAIRCKRHQVRRFSTDTPARVIGMYYALHRDVGTQVGIGDPYRPLGASQRILADRTLRQA